MWVVSIRTRRMLALVRLIDLSHGDRDHLTSFSVSFIGLVGAPACGDVMKLQVEVDENGKIVDAKFKTFGCGSAIGEYYSLIGIVILFLILILIPW